MNYRSALPLLVLCACGNGSRATDAGDADADAGAVPQIFVRAADGVPGGTLLAVHMIENVDFFVGQYPDRAYLAGGYVGVDPATLPAGAHPGRLLAYDGQGTFRTVCTSDQVLRAVWAARGTVYAAGDGGRVITYDTAQGQCGSLQITGSDPAHPPTVRAIAGGAALPFEIYFAGSVEDATGPAALYLFDGTAFTRVALPPEGQTSHLEAITYQHDLGYRVGGTNAALFQRTATGTDWTYERAPLTGDDIDVIAIDTEHALMPSSRIRTFAAAGRTTTTLLTRARADTSWQVLPQVSQPNDVVRGIYTSTECEAYAVGTRGFAGAFISRGLYAPPGPRLTGRDLYAVHGASGRVIAVGGDESTRDASQSAVILVRGDDQRGHYTVDGVSYPASAGNLIVDFGGGYANNCNTQ